MLESKGQNIPNPDSSGIRRSSVFFEIGGNAMVYSLNYDYIIPQNDHFKIALTIGTAYHNHFDIQSIYFNPQLNLLIGRRKLSAEFGLGLTTAIAINHPRETYFALRLGIRHQKLNGGFMWRVAFTPFLFIENDMPIFPYAGFSIGYTFKCKHKKTQHI